jgi:carbon starvation protein
VFTAAGLAFMPAPGAPWTLAAAGSGGLLLWPLFGATNQLLGGLAFIVIAAWLIKNRRPWWFIVVPAALMLAIPAWALVIQAFVGGENLESWWAREQWVLVGVSVFMLAVEAWMVVELAIRLRQGLGARALQPSAEVRA